MKWNNKIGLSILWATLAITATVPASVCAGPFDRPEPIRLVARIQASAAPAPTGQVVEPVVLEAARPMARGRIEIRVDPGEVQDRVESYKVWLAFVGRIEPAALGSAMVVVDFQPARGPRPGSSGSPWVGPHDSERMLSAGNTSFTNEIIGWPEDCRPCTWQFDYRLELVGEPAAAQVSISWALDAVVVLRGTGGLEPGKSTRIDIARLRNLRDAETPAEDPSVSPGSGNAFASEPVALNCSAQTPVRMYQIAVTTDTIDGANLELRLLAAPEPDRVYHQVVSAAAPSSVSLPGLRLRSSNLLAVDCHAPCRRVYWLVTGSGAASLDLWLHLRPRSGLLGAERTTIVPAASAYSNLHRIMATGDPPYLRRTVSIEVVPVGERAAPIGLYAYAFVERLDGTHGCCPVNYALGNGRLGARLDQAVIDSMYFGHTRSGSWGHRLQHSAPTSLHDVPKWLHFLGTCGPAEVCRQSLDWNLYAGNFARASDDASQTLGLRIGVFALSTGGEDLRDRVRIDLRVE